MSNRQPVRSEPLSTIRVSPNGRYFVDRRGSPTFWLGDTQWELFRAYTPETAHHILRDRRDKGFSAILVMLTGVDHGQFSPQPIPYTNLAGEHPWPDGDPLRPNEAYFRHIDDVIRLASGPDLAGLCLVVGIYHQWHRDLVTPANARAWARWVANRYRDVPNLIWSMYPRAEESYVPVCRELAAGLQEGDGGAHLISVHPDPSVASSSFIHTEPWLAFNMIQTCITYERIPEAVWADYVREPIKPVVMAEGGYEGLEFGKLQTALEIRQQAYWSQLAGGYHVYGHQDAWTNPEAWPTWLDAPGARDLRTFRDVLTSLPAWWTLTPAQDLIAAADQPAPGPLAARSEEGGWTVVYLGAPGTVTLALPTPPATATWVDPHTGDRRPAAPAASYTTPSGWEDALLLLT